MLPHSRADFQDVIHDLRDSGYPFEFDWFAPHFRVSLPAPSATSPQRDLQVELPHRARTLARPRRGSASGGTVRYVDSSSNAFK